ncbi:MAG: hypothetical protein ABJA93_07910 [Sporichthyaceae bacterium]
MTIPWGELPIDDGRACWMTLDEAAVYTATSVPVIMRAMLSRELTGAPTPRPGARNCLVDRDELNVWAERQASLGQSR